MVNVTSFLFGQPKPWSGYGFVALRLIVAAVWINSNILKFSLLAAGHPMAHPLVQSLFGSTFGSSMVIPLTYFFSSLELLGAVAFILGLLVRLASVWGVIEFAIICTNSLLVGNIAAAVAGVTPLMLTASLVLLLYGSPKLSLDGLIAKRKTSK